MLDFASFFFPSSKNSHNTEPMDIDDKVTMVGNNTADTSPSSSHDDYNDCTMLCRLRKQSRLDSDDFSTAVVVPDIEYQHNPHSTSANDSSTNGTLDSIAAKWIMSGPPAHQEGIEVVVANASNSTTNVTTSVHHTLNGDWMNGLSSHRPGLCTNTAPLLVDGEREIVLRRPDFLVRKDVDATSFPMKLAPLATTAQISSSGTHRDARAKASFGRRGETAVQHHQQLLLAPSSSARSSNQAAASQNTSNNTTTTTSQSRSCYTSKDYGRMTKGKTAVSDDDDHEKALVAEAALWKTAMDPKSGRAYWYHTRTRETQWRKPMCCATRQERKDAQRKEEQTRDFFAAMEANVLRSMATGAYTKSTTATAAQTKSQPKSHSMIVASSSALARKIAKEVSERMICGNNDSEQPSSRPSSSAAVIHRPSMIRTISSMEDSVLADLIKRVPSHRQVVMLSTTDTTGVSTSNLKLLEPIPEVASTASSTLETSSSLDDNNKQLYLSWNDSSSSSEEFAAPPEQQQKHRDYPQREPSLHFSALVASQQASSQNGSSFNLSTLMCDNDKSVSSTARGGGFNYFGNDVIPEAVDEDASIGSNNSALMRGNCSLVRETGSINLARSGSLHPDNNNDDSSNINNNDSRVGLARMNGSLSLEVPNMDGVPECSQAPVTREDSMNLAALVSGGDRGSGVSRESSISSKLNEGFRRDSWGSFLADSAVTGLSSEEGEAMMELVAITQEMAKIESSSSSPSSIDSLDGVNVLSDSECKQSNSRILFHESSLDLSDDEGGTPDAAGKGLPKQQASASRPSIARPSSLRDTPEPKVVATKMLEKPGMLRRNTCGTLYVGSTMSAPDKDATIKCVCAVFRAHILQSEIDSDATTDEYHVFNDLESQRKLKVRSLGTAAESTPPTLENISLFYRDVFGRAQMESDCIIMTLIYVERLIKVTDGALRPRVANWRSILFSCMVLSSKVWDDLSMWNADFSLTCPAGVEFSLQRVNELEIAILAALQYQVKVPASEYAKYYFLLRSMLIKSGLGSEDLTTMNPLDVEGAKQLQHVSSQYQSSVASRSTMQKVALGRAKSTGTKVTVAANGFRTRGSKKSSNFSPIPETRSKVGLEHVVQM